MIGRAANFFDSLQNHLGWVKGESETEMMKASEEQGEKETESEIREEHQKGQKEPPDDREEIPKGRIPVMLVVGGHSRVGRSAVARQFADYLKCPLLNKDDITIALEQSLSLVNSSAESTATVEHLVNHLPFQSLCQIASTQLGLQINIILNTPLSRRPQFERLKQLAVDGGARMIIVDCRSLQDDIEYEDEDEDDEDEYYDVGSIPKFIVDPKRPLETKELAAILRRDQGNPSSQTLSSKVGFRELGNYRKTGEEAQSHLHELAYSEEVPAVGNGKGLNCQKCGLLISSGPIYGCVECDAFNLHSYCAKSPQKTPSQLRKDCPAYLKAKSTPQYNFPQTNRCQFCERSNKGFSADCFDCLLQTHLHCNFLPTIFTKCSLGHPLKFLITPLSYNYEYRCSVCDTFGMSVSYKCYQCNCDLHVDCALAQYQRSSVQEKIRVALHVKNAALAYINAGVAVSDLDRINNG